jgi:signal transduction histidine kinase
MRLYEQKIWWKRILFIVAIGIGLYSLWYTQKLVEKLAKEEERKVLLWANATRQLVNAEGDFTFLLDIIKDNETIPVILLSDKDEIIAFRNLDSAKSDDEKYLRSQLNIMKEDHEPIPILYDDANHRYNYLYYRNSVILTQLKQYPYYQLSVIAVFILISYLAFSSSRRAEQNQVWVGMSKETAHQLGTPISSLMGWINLIRETEKDQQEELLAELEKDVKRLELVTERFSKIGSAPKLETEIVDDILQDSINYLQARTSQRIAFILERNEDELTAQMNVPLFEWVIENICKNAIDAMAGEGSITMRTQARGDSVLIDITDTGKGIVPSKLKTVFKPGYTTKKRGWGLGLSLAKRIIEDYHRGKVFVKHSEVNKGTTFRIILQA